MSLTTHRKNGKGTLISIFNEPFQNNKSKVPFPKIALSSQDSICFVYPEEIIMCKASNNYTIVFLKNSEKKVICKTLKDFEKDLSSFSFFRTHQSFLVNLIHVVEYVRRDCSLILTNKNCAYVSKQKRDQLFTFLTPKNPVPKNDAENYPK